MKKILACLSLAFYIAAIAMFALSFVDGKAVVLSKTSVSSLATGFEIAFGQTNLEAGNMIGTLLAFIFVVIGALAACYALFVAFTQKKKSKKANKNAKLLCSVCSFVVCALVPALLIFLTLQTTNTASSASAFGGLLGANTQLGIGAILSAVFTLVGGCALSVVELK